jgi:GNAT superfamily N-acetyltransferase
MGCELRFLDQVPFHEIHRAMEASFADYALDMSYMTEAVLRNRAIKNGVELSVSPGVFSEGRLVGLTLVGLGAWKGQAAAFDAATGIIKEFRGQRLAGRLFDFALPALHGRGVSRFLLEVLQENAPAVKAYEKTGFRITRPFVCYELKADRTPVAPGSSEIRSIERDRLDEFAAHLDWQPSWENTFDAIRAISDGVRLYGAFEGSACVGLVAYYPTLRWIMTLVVKRSHRYRGIGTALLEHALRNVESGKKPVRANNVDSADRALARVLEKAGFVPFTTQYEMEFEIP